MTRIDKSPEQLDAEAVRGMLIRAGRCEIHRIHDTCHADPLTKWRTAAQRESPTKLTSSYPPEMTETVDGVRVRIIDPGTRVGFTMSNGMQQYLDGSGGHAFPLHDALRLWDRECRRRHRNWPDHRGRPVCAEIAWMVLMDQTSVAFAADQAGVSWTRAERLLVMGIKYMRRLQLRWVGESEMSTARHDPEACHDCLLADPERRRNHDKAMCATCRKREAA